MLKPEVTRRRMDALGATQLSLAAECGVDVRTLQRWFAGQKVGLSRAEQVAGALGMGTGELFTGVPEETGAAISARLRLVQRLLSGRDSAFAQGFRLLQEHFDTVLQTVSFAAHPVRGYVSRVPLETRKAHRFVGFHVECSADDAEIGLRCQLGRRFGYLIAGMRLQGAEARLVETFQTRSMLATRASDGSVRLWFWVGPEHRELIFVSNRELTIESQASDGRTLLALDAAADAHVLCVRPNVLHLRAAGLPMGFDRMTGQRAGRVDVEIDWDPTTLSSGPPRG